MPGTGSGTESETETEADTEAESGTESEPETDTDTEPGTETERLEDQSSPGCCSMVTSVVFERRGGSSPPVELSRANPAEAGRFASLDNSTARDGWEGMNTTEVTMKQHRQPSKRRLEAHALALQAVGIIVPLAGKTPTPMKSVADQLIRASSSVALNLAEGNGRVGRDRIHHWRIAYGSALETSTALQILVAASYFPAETAAKAEALLDRVRAMTWRLIHRVR